MEGTEPMKDTGASQTGREEEAREQDTSKVGGVRGRTGGRRSTKSQAGQNGGPGATAQDNSSGPGGTAPTGTAGRRQRAASERGGMAGGSAQPGGEPAPNQRAHQEDWVSSNRSGAQGSGEVF